MFQRMGEPQNLTILVLGLLGVFALIGAVVTSSVTGTLPHDMVGLVAAVVGYLIGVGHGRTTERLADMTRRNGNNPHA